MEMKEVKAKAEEKRCPLQRAIVFIEGFLSEPMCGECFPCSLGSHELEIRLQKIAEGKGTQSDIDAMDRIAAHTLEVSRCRKGMDTARFIIDCLKEVSFKEHLEDICRQKECLPLITYRILPQKCRMCGTCQDICKDKAIIGERKKPTIPSYQPLEIVLKRCRSGCHECIKVCPRGAIAVVNTLSPGEKKILFRITRELEELLKIESEVEGLGYLPFEIIQERCDGCGECIKVCPSEAIEVQGVGFRPFEIVQKRCTGCGECIKACPSGAIEAVYIKEQVAVGS